MLTTPNFLFQYPSNHRLCFFVLEILNNVIQYQYHGKCPPYVPNKVLGNISGLLYTLIRARRLFYSLVELKVEDHKEITEEATKDGAAPKQVFVPTTEWACVVCDPSTNCNQLESWKSKLPIQTVLVFLNAVVPPIKQLYKGTAEDEQAVLNYLKGKNRAPLFDLL